MLPSLLAGSLWVLIAAFQSASWTWMSAAELRAGAEKAEFGSIESATGAKPVCGTPNRSEPPLGEVEVCRWSARAWEVAALFVKDRSGTPRVVAYSVRGPSAGFNQLSDRFREQLGNPARRSSGAWGESIEWRMGAGWTVVHSSCALEVACLEVSQDMTARRLARSTGVFLSAYQPI